MAIQAIQNYFESGSNNVSNNVPAVKERPDVIATAHHVIWVARFVIGVLGLISFWFPLAAIATAYAAYEVSRIAENMVDLNDPQKSKHAANRIETIFKGAPVAEWLYQYYYEQRGTLAKGIRA